MQQLRRLSALAFVMASLAACADAPTGGITAPDAARLIYYELGDYKIPLEDEIRAQIACVYESEDPKLVKQVENKTNDFNAIVAKAAKGSDPKTVQAVKDFVNNFVKWSKDFLNSGKITTETVCGGTPLAAAAQQLYNMLFLYSGQYSQIATPDFGPNSQVVFCPVDGCQYPAPGPESYAEGAAIYVPPNTFPVPVLITWHPTTVTHAFSEGEAYGTAYEFTVTPNLTGVNAWDRYICLSHEDYDDGLETGGTFAMFKLTGTLWEQLDPGSQDIICRDPDETASSSILWRGVTRVASVLAKPFQPATLWALQHRAIGGPSTAASPHQIVLIPPDEETEATCTNPTGWQVANGSGQWDFRISPYPGQHLHSITVRLSTNTGTTIFARRLTSSGTGAHDLDFGTAGTPVSRGENDYEITFTWPNSSTVPGGDVQFDVHNAAGVSFGTTTASPCVLRTFAGESVTGSLATSPPIQ